MILLFSNIASGHDVPHDSMIFQTTLYFKHRKPK